MYSTVHYVFIKMKLLTILKCITEPKCKVLRETIGENNWDVTTSESESIKRSIIKIRTKFVE